MHKTMKSHNIQVMQRIAWSSSRPKSSTYLGYRLSNSLIFKLYSKKMSVRLSYSRPLHVFAIHSGFYCNLDFQSATCRPKNHKFDSPMVKFCPPIETAIYNRANNNLKWESTFQTSVDGGDLLKKEHIDKQFIGLVEPFMKITYLTPDDIQVKILNTENGIPLALMDRSHMSCGLPYTLLNTLAAPPKADVSVSSVINELCNICDDGVGAGAQDVHANHILFSTSGEVSPSSQKSDASDAGKDLEGHLNRVANVLSKELPELFTGMHNYSIYRNDLIFENNIRQSRSVGLTSYMMNLSMLRIIGHLRYAFVRLDILRLTKHPEENTVKVRWRIVGMSSFKALPLPFRLKKFQMKEAEKHMEHWYDALSTFYIDDKGLIYKHVLDNKMEGEERQKVKKPTLLAKLAALVGVNLRTPASAPVTSNPVDFRAYDAKGVTMINPSQQLMTVLMANNE